MLIIPVNSGDGGANLGVGGTMDLVPWARRTFKFQVVGSEKLPRAGGSEWSTVRSTGKVSAQCPTPNLKIIKY